MTSITVNAASTPPLEVDQTGETIRAKSASPVPVNASTVAVADDANRDLAEKRLTSARPALAVTLENKLKAFDRALSSFVWPTDSDSMARARLVLPSADLQGKVTAEIKPTDQAQPYSRFVSRGFKGADPTDLAPGGYTIKASLGQDTDTLTVNVGRNDTNDQVLAKVAQAVNQSKLPIQAQVVNEVTAGQNPSSNRATGSPTDSVLTVDLNPARDTSALSLQNGQGLLLDSLDLTATRDPSGPASTGSTSLQGLSVYRPTTIQSASFDPRAATTLSPGQYGLTVAMGTRSYDVSVLVSAGETWKDVLKTAARAISGTGLGTMDIQSVSRFSSLVTDPEYYPKTEGVALSGQAQDPKIGERLTVTGGGQTQAAGGSLSSDNLLSALKLAAVWPGSDAVMAVNGRTQTRAPGVFSLDQGRLEVSLDSSFVKPLPLTVTTALDRLSTTVSDVAASYSDLRSFLLSNQDLLRTDAGQAPLSDRLRAPLVQNQVGLPSMGLKEWGARKLLSVDAETFLASAAGNPTAVRSALEGDQGLLTSWRATTQDMLNKDLSAQVVSRSSLENAYLPPPGQEVDLAKKHRLVNLLG